MALPHSAHLRIARPARGMDAAVKFWVEGFGMKLQGRKIGQDDSWEEIAFIGWPTSAWHLELVQDASVTPTPTEEDLLVLYLEGPADPELLARVEQAGGVRTPSRNPYWDENGITFADPDGYLIVLASRAWE